MGDTVSVPDFPGVGTVVADLATFKEYVGARTSQDDTLMQKRLDAATAAVYRVVYLEDRGAPDVQEAILLTASKLYKRRQSPEGVTGFGIEGVAVRVVARDPDVKALLVKHLDMTNAGLA